MSSCQFTIIHLATDHAGFDHKEAVREWLANEGMVVIDHGATAYDEEDHFPEFIALASRAVAAGGAGHAAVIFGGSGQGEAMMANRFAGVRATVYYGGNESIISLSREHNNANVLSIGARFVSVDETKRVVWNWLFTPTLSNEKYHHRNQLLDTLAL
jgi:ribose 5-phosphate isomerase B